MAKAVTVLNPATPVEHASFGGWVCHPTEGWLGRDAIGFHPNGDSQAHSQPSSTSEAPASEPLHKAGAMQRPVRSRLGGERARSAHASRGTPQPPILKGGSAPVTPAAAWSRHCLGTDCVNYQLDSPASRLASSSVARCRPSSGEPGSGTSNTISSSSSAMARTCTYWLASLPWTK